jgi:steroid 5-alpha reductase family enzyme/uncharacterized membrane protein
MDNLILYCIFIISWSCLGFVVSRVIRRNDIADIMWGAGVFVISCLHVYIAPVVDIRSILVFCFIIFWAFRLSFLILFRFSKNKEDKRYHAWRVSWGSREPIYAFFQIFLLQTFLLSIVSLPLFWITNYSVSLISYWDFIGVSLAIIGLVFEMVSDKQMDNFRKKSSEGEILDEGLWSLCRHPNYFGEVLFWWGVFFFAMSVDKGILSIVSPLLTTYLLVKVSGVPMLERFLSQKGQAFERYLIAVPRKLLPFGMKDVYTFFLLLIVLFFLDYLWLSILMKGFYIEQSRHITNLSGGSWQPVIWAVVGVYFSIALGLMVFSIKKSSSVIEAFFYGSLFGFISYGIYEFTNIALLKSWPIEMALIDIVWGGVLCGFSSYLVKKIISSTK